MNKKAALPLLVFLIIALVTGFLAWWPVASSAQQQTGNSSYLNKVARKIDINEVYEIEVNHWPPRASRRVTFKAQLQQGMWLITSKHDFPADLTDRIGDIIGAVINLKRGPLISGDRKRHSDLRVNDPRKAGSVDDESYGQQISLRNKQGEVLLDLIFGRYETKLECSYLRKSGEDNVYSSTAFLYLQADWIGWVKKRIIEQTFNQCTEITIQAFSGKAMQEQNIFSYNSKTRYWSFQSEKINLKALNAYVGYLLSAELYDVLPHASNRILLQQSGLLIPENQEPSAPLMHTLRCSDGSYYKIYLSRAVTKPYDVACRYMLVTVQPGSQSSAIYQYRYQHFIFVVKDSDMQMLTFVPENLLLRH